MANWEEHSPPHEEYDKEILYPQIYSYYSYYVLKFLVPYYQKLKMMAQQKELKWLGDVNLSSICFSWMTASFLVRGSIDEWQHIQSLLEVYGAAYGQCINKQNTLIMFSSNTEDKIRHQIKNITGVNICHSPGTYLELPSIIGRSKNKTFAL